MIPWTSVAEWGQRLAVITGITTTAYGGLSYLKLNPVTESFVTSQIEGVNRNITSTRADTLDTKRVVLGLARNDLVREKQALEGAVKNEKNSMSLGTWYRRLDTINMEIERIDRAVQRLDERIEGMKKDE